MKKIIKYIPLFILIASLTSCLKSNPYFEDFSSTQPIADIPKAPANTVTVSTAPTNSWFLLDSTAAGVDYQTAVHIAAKEHVGDVVVRMKIDKAAANTWIANHPTAGYTLLPDSLYSVSSYDVTIPNAGVFNTADFVVHIRSGVRDPSTGTTANPIGKSIFKTNKFILPVSIDTLPNNSYTIASNFRTILWYIRVK